MLAQKDAVAHIAQNFMDSEDAESPDLKEIDIAQEKLLLEWHAFSSQLAVNVLETITNSQRL